MAISKVSEKELDEVLEALSQTNVDVIYIADSFGSFYPEQIRDLVKKLNKEGKSQNEIASITMVSQKTICNDLKAINKNK